MTVAQTNPSSTSTDQTARQWSYASGTSDTPLLGLTIGDMFDQTVEKYPDNAALISRHQNIRFTYRELQAEINQCAKGLMQLGFKKGERIGIWSPNRSEWCITQFATSKIGVILVNINPSYRLNELEYVLNQSGCSGVVIAPAFKTSNYTEMLTTLVPELRQCEPGKLQSARVPALTTVIRMGPDKVPATLSHHNILNNGYFVAHLQNFTHKDRLCIPVPLYHCFGMVMANLGCITHGATMVSPSEGFEPLAVLEAVQEEKCTALYGVPTMFIAELGHPDFDKFDLTSLRTGVMAGAPCPSEVMKKVISLMHMSEVEICYGMTETSPVSTQTRIDAPLDKRVSTVGLVSPHLEIKIVDPTTGKVVPTGTPGELCTRGYSVMIGYWNNAEATATAIDSSHWMHTGDLATMDAEGYVNIVGRIKDMIIRGGENIYPREIEEFLYTHPKIADVQVIGVPDVKYGEELMAWVKLRPGVSVDAESLRAFCKGKIATYKIPRYYKFVDGFPMTVTGKVQKYKMREVAIGELGLEQASRVKTA